MKLLFPSGASRIQSALLVGVFVVFVCNAAGVTSFQFALANSVAFHGEIIGELMAGRLPEQLTRIDFAAFLITGAALALSLPLLAPIAASLLTAFTMVPTFYIAWAFPTPPPLIPMEYTLICILVLFSVNVLCSYFIENHERQKIVAVFGQYVPAAVVAEIARRPQAYSMASEAREMTVIFCDIKDFSKISEQVEPHELGEMLNVFLTDMTAVLHRHGATIDKYIGDAIMAFWGAPVWQADHAQQAVSGALAMQQAMKGVRETFQQRGWPAIEVGVGINSARVNVGNMGSRYRIAYTVVGDAVNLAARLEALTRLYGVGVLTSESTKNACTNLRCREIDHVRVKGKGRPTRVFEPLAEGVTPTDEFLKEHHEALEAYYGGAWSEAEKAFAELGKEAANTTYYETMSARIADHDKPADWSGVVVFGGDLSYTLESKAQA